MNKTIRLAGIVFESLVNGPGLRRVFFSQGCTHHCKGCFNPHTHDFTGGYIKDIDKLVNSVIENTMLKGVTFSGGDPFQQADKFSIFAKELKKHNINIWCYTGYTFEYILKALDCYEGWKDLLNNIDVLVDGKFEEDKKIDGLTFKGSSNQRIIDVKKTLEANKIILANELEI